MGDESKCGGQCQFSGIATPESCAVLHYKMKEALKELEELQDMFTTLDKKTAVLAMKVTIVSAVISSSMVLVAKFLLVI